MTEKTFQKNMLDAINNGALHEVIELINNDQERLHFIGVFGTWLHYAARHGKLELVRYFVSQGIDVNSYCKKVSSGFTPIRAAASRGHIEVAKYLLQNGALLDVSQGIDNNPLFAAVVGKSVGDEDEVGGYPEMVKLLLEHGIDAKIRYQGKYNSNRDALALAYERGEEKIVSILRPYALGEAVFYDGEGYSAPLVDENYDYDGWKVFDKDGNRIGLFNSDATQKVGK